MKNPRNVFVDLIREICKEEDIEFKSFSDDWVIKLCKNGRTSYIIGYFFSLNSDSSSIICRDKAATSDILSDAGIPNVRRHIFGSPSSASHKYVGDGIEGLKRLLEKHETLVLGPYDGTCGIDIHKVENDSQLEDAMKKIFLNNDALVASKYYDIQHEYRVVCLEGKPVLVFDKIRADHWQHNLSHGAKPEVVDDSDPAFNVLKDLAIRAADTLNTYFSSIDIIQDETGEYKILEVNSGVMMAFFASSSKENRVKAKNIYKNAISAMLNDSRRFTS